MSEVEPDDEELLTEVLTRRAAVGDLIEYRAEGKAFLNAVWMARTSRGEFVVKRHAKQVTTERLEWTADFVDRLQESSFPCDGFIASPSGERAVSYQGSLYTIHSFLPGECFTGGVGRLTDQQRDSATSALADYHAIVSTRVGDADPPSFIVPPEADRPSGHPMPDPAILLFTEKVDDVQQYVLDDAMDADLLGMLADVFDELRQFFAGRAYAELPRVVVHGDYRHKNMVFQGDRFAGLFDWDFVQRAPRLVDLCGRFAQYHLDMSERAGDDTPIRHYLDVYGRRAAEVGVPLTAGERAALPTMLRAGVIHTGVVVAAYLRDSPLMAGESEEQRRAEIQRRLGNSARALRGVNRLSTVPG